MKLEGGIKILILASFLVLIFFPESGYAQQINISVSARVTGTSTPVFCGDGICNDAETCGSCPADCSSCGGGGVVIPSETTVIFKGRAYPLANLTILKNNIVISTFKAQEGGLFERTINGIAGGTYNFSIFAEDTEGRRSVTIGFTVSILEGRNTTISGIFIPPTIEIYPIQATKGQKINIVGQVFPESEVNIFISPIEIVKQTKSSSQGEWMYELDTSALEEKEYSARAKAFYGEGEQSSFSQTVSFLVLPRCRGADLNFDGKVDLVDFSILLYFWGQKNPANRCADINSDGIVNIVDFSIMMYWWTG